MGETESDPPMCVDLFDMSNEPTMPGARTPHRPQLETMQLDMLDILELSNLEDATAPTARGSASYIEVTSSYNLDSGDVESLLLWEEATNTPMPATRVMAVAEKNVLTKQSLFPDAPPAWFELPPPQMPKMAALPKPAAGLYVTPISVHAATGPLPMAQRMPRAPRPAQRNQTFIAGAALGGALTLLGASLALAASYLVGWL